MRTNKRPSLWHMKAQRETWFCSSKTQRWATPEQSVNTGFLGIRETPGTSEAETCVGVLAVLPSICQKSSMFLHITHWQSCLPSKNIMKCSLYTQISPFPEEEMEKPVPPYTHTNIAITKQRETFKSSSKRKSTQRPALGTVILHIF